MAAWGYEFYLLVLKVSLTSESERPCNILYLSHKLRCYTRISSPEENRNNTREKIRYFSRCVWYNQSAADTSFAFRATRSGWWMTAKPSPFSIQGRLSEIFWTIAAKTLKNQYCLQTVLFNLPRRGRKPKYEKKTESYVFSGFGNDISRGWEGNQQLKGSPQADFGRLPEGFLCR